MRRAPSVTATSPITAPVLFAAAVDAAAARPAATTSGPDASPAGLPRARPAAPDEGIGGIVIQKDVELWGYKVPPPPETLRGSAYLDYAKIYLSQKLPLWTAVRIGAECLFSSEFA